MVLIPKSRNNPQAYMKEVSLQKTVNLINAEVYQQLKSKLQFEDKKYIGNYVNFIQVYKEKDKYDPELKYNFIKMRIPRAFGQAFFED